MKTIKIVVEFEEKLFKVRVPDTCTISGLQIKLRKHLKMTDTEACFIFFKIPYMFGTKEKLFPAAKLISEIQYENYDVSKYGVMNVVVLKESTFGAWNKGFCSAKIEKKKELFVVTITWSWYAIVTWTVVEVFNNLEEAKSYVLKERCAGGLTLSL